MSRTLVVLLLGTGIFISIGLLPAGELESGSGAESITRHDIQAVIGFLASDHLKGRGNGTPSLELAAAYIASEFQRCSLKASGDGGTYFQNFDLYSARPGEDNRLGVVSENRARSFQLGYDYLPSSGSPNVSVTAPAAFVGYGITHPQYDDYAGADVRGKIAIALSRWPKADDEESLLSKFSLEDYTSPRAKARSAAQHGALGLILVVDPKGRQKRIPSLEESFPPDSSPRRKPMALEGGSDGNALPVVTVNPDVGEQLLAGAGHTLSHLQNQIDQNGRPHFLDLPGTRILLQTSLQRQRIPSRNVAGLWEGSDPKLKEEVVVIGAHYDHEGEGNGQIWNGADDDASGTTGLLELAEAFEQTTRRPKRSILLVAWGAEEKGLLGSRFYVHRPLLPLENTVAMLQMDMIGRNEQHDADPRNGVPEEKAENNKNTVNVLGSPFSPELKSLVGRLNEAVGLELRFRYDFDRQNLIKRSDHWPFLQKKVPAAFFFTGLHPDYHTPRDTPDKINYEKMEKIIRLVYRTAVELANATTPPRFLQPEKFDQGSL
ncbi:MAG: M20/M25/M40 family metallo-hydrolase [Acidobacteria bacterium]|nr:M20/M25/M40 family metallo-hydrolase [Acidobacteriota bacterium]